MRKILQGIVELLTLFCLITSLVACNSAQTSTTGTPTPTPLPTPTPTPIPTTRVTIRVDSVFCNGKVAVFGWQSDLFYLQTAFTASSPNPKDPVVVKSLLSTPTAMSDGKELAIEPEPFIALDAIVPLNSTIRGGLLAYSDGVQANQIAQFASWGFTITKQLGDNLQQEGYSSGNEDDIEDGAVMSMASQFFVSLLGSSNGQTQLGKQEIEITAAGPLEDPRTLDFKQDEGPGKTWDYVINYTVLRVPSNI
jgi:hypothetical protein